MRPLGPILVAVSSVVAIAATLPSAATASVTALEDGTPAASAAVASPASSRIAVLAAPGRLQVSAPGGPTRTFSIDEACNLTSAINATEAFVCGGNSGGPIAVDLVTGAQHRVPQQRISPDSTEETFTPTRAGRRWLEGTMDFGKAFIVGAYVDRVTGRALEARGAFGDRAPARWGSLRFPDLDRVGLARRTCRYVERHEDVTTRAYGRLVQVGMWTIARSGAATLLQRCGSRRTLRIGSRTVVLGARQVAWVDDARVHLRTLATGRTRAFSVAAGTRIALSRTRLVISQPAPGLLAGLAAYRVTTVPLS